MRSLMFLLLLLLVCCLQRTSSASLGVKAAKSICCSEFSNVRIPLRRVVSFYRTSSICPIQAVVFKTAAGKEFCVKLEETWVNRHMAEVSKRTTAVPTATAKTQTTSI